MAAVFAFRVFKAGSKTRNASPMPKFVPSDLFTEILDLECVLCHVTGVQNENKNDLKKYAMLDLSEERCIHKVMARI